MFYKRRKLWVWQIFQQLSIYIIYLSAHLIHCLAQHFRTFFNLSLVRNVLCCSGFQPQLQGFGKTVVLDKLFLSLVKCNNVYACFRFRKFNLVQQFQYYFMVVTLHFPSFTFVPMLFVSLGQYCNTLIDFNIECFSHIFTIYCCFQPDLSSMLYTCIYCTFLSY